MQAARLQAGALAGQIGQILTELAIDKHKAIAVAGQQKRFDVRPANPACGWRSGVQRPLLQRRHIGKAPFLKRGGGESDFPKAHLRFLAQRLQPGGFGAKVAPGN